MATPTTLAELAPFWRADDNEGVSLESVSKEIAAYKPGGTFAEDYAAFVQLLQVVAHPKVGAVAIAKPGDKAEGAEGEEKAENSRVGVRNHVVASKNIKLWGYKLYVKWLAQTEKEAYDMVNIIKDQLDVKAECGYLTPNSRRDKGQHAQGSRALLHVLHEVWLAECPRCG